jgi:hypothetical protein
MCIGEKKGAYKFLVGNMRKADHCEGLGENGRIILKLFFSKWDKMA